MPRTNMAIEVLLKAEGCATCTYSTFKRSGMFLLGMAIEHMPFWKSLRAFLTLKSIIDNLVGSREG